MDRDQMPWRSVMLRNIQEIYTSVPGSPLFASAQTDLKPAEKAFVGLLLFFLKKKMDLNNRCHYYSFFFFLQINVAVAVTILELSGNERLWCDLILISVWLGKGATFSPPSMVTGFPETIESLLQYP